MNDHAASSVEPVNLDARTSRVRGAAELRLALSQLHAAAVACSNKRRSGARYQRQLRLSGVDVTDENCAIGAILNFNAIGRNVDRRIAVVSLKRGDQLCC